MASAEPVIVDATVRVTRQGRYLLEFSADGQHRRLEGADCKQIAEAAALLLALLIDPNLSKDHRDSASAVQPQLETRATEPSPKSPPSDSAVQASAMRSSPPKQRDRGAPTKIDKSRLELIGEIAARLDWGSWPKPEPSIVAGFGIQTSTWRMLGHAGLGKRISMLGESQAQLDLMPITFALEPALRLLLGRWGLEPGVGLELGLTHHRSPDLTPKTYQALSLTFLTLLRATLDIGLGLRGWLGIGAGLPLIRPRWIHQSGDVYHTFGPSIRGELGIQTGF